jgi:hypothetical protein
MATNEGTDQKSAERNLRLEYENLKKDEFVKKEFEPKPPAPKPAKKMAKGGSASSRADGIAQRGKTRGKIV